MYHSSKRVSIPALRPGQVVHIAGAGPAGLAAAITLARQAVRVVVHEVRRNVGQRFQSDLQGLENWSSERDVLQVLEDQALPSGFSKYPCRYGTLFDSWGKKYTIRSDKPIFYLLERGPGPGTLDTALLQCAQALGVEVRFNSRLAAHTENAILATGPKVADAIAVGYHFGTDMADGFWVICDNELAPKGYAYLLVMHGKGTLKTCMFAGFKQQQLYVKRTVAAFERLLDLHMVNPIPHGGVCHFQIPVLTGSAQHPAAGERAGFQDMLWGFGMRLAMTSGVLAARSLLGGTPYDKLWQAELGGQVRTAVVNRVLYEMMGNRAYRWFLRHTQNQTDIRAYLRRHYQPSTMKWLALPWANWVYRRSREELGSSYSH